MASSHTLILNSGGLRSLVATALMLHDPPRPRVTLVHVSDGRPTRDRRREHARRQAEAFDIKGVIELNLFHLYGHGLTHSAAVTPDGRAVARLAAPQMLTAALGQAALRGADHVVWPASCDGDAAAMARGTEQALLCAQAADVELTAPIAVETPLLEFTDQQVIEVGVQLRVPWHLAWSCMEPGERPCGLCEGCRRRGRAFEAAGVLDPTATTAATGGG